MSVLGSNCCHRGPPLFVKPKQSSSSLLRRVSSPSCNGGFWEKLNLMYHMDSNRTILRQRYQFREICIVKSSMNASFSGTSDDSTAIFPRINVKDPHKRLGISKEASEEEIQAARNYLINKYAGHKPSVDAIESAHDKIIMQWFHERRKPKLNIKKKVRDVTQSPVVKAITNRFEAPSTTFIIMTAIPFIALGVLTVLFPTEEGPTLQVAISLIASIYFICQRLKSRLRAFLYGIGTFFGSWLLGTFLMVSVIPPLLHGPRSLEVTTSLLTYVLLWISSTYLK